jgi:tryptophanyl-tRNA synthetase
MSDLSRMTQFKDKSGRGIKKWKEEGEEKREIISGEEYWMHKTLVGLFDYPVLMAADILLYNTDIVPVGEDQVQHVELARELAKRFNRMFGETFVVPEPNLVKEGMRIMGLDDPTKKMSKSASSVYNYISLTDDPDTAREKIMRAVTDSGKEVKYLDTKPAIKNLINIYALLDNATPKEIAQSYRGKGYAEFKKDLAEIVVDFLKGFQEKYNDIDDREVLNILEGGKEKAGKLARAKMEDVRQKIGLL